MTPRCPESLQPSSPSRIGTDVGKTPERVSIWLGLRACDLTEYMILTVFQPQHLYELSIYLFLLFTPLLTFLSVKAAKLLMKKLYIRTVLKLSH